MEKVADGKTKFITPLWKDAPLGKVTSTNDITARDGVEHDVLREKNVLSTQTTCNIFEYLRSHRIPVAYIGRGTNPATFLTQICKMIPVEVVVRNSAQGSYCKRHPDVAEGTLFENPIVEFYYKTTNQTIGTQTLPCNDPLMIWNADEIRYDLQSPSQPDTDRPFGSLQLSPDEVEILRSQLRTCRLQALAINQHLKDGFKRLDATLQDFKVEFGILPDGPIVLADVIDCDSWRLEWMGYQISKQVYRDGKKAGVSIEELLQRTLGVYKLGLALTDRLVSQYRG